MEVYQGIKAWEKIIKKSLDIICTIDSNGKVLNINEACKSIIGYDVEELRGRQFKDFIHPEDFAATLNIVQEIVNGYKTNSFENRYIHKLGKEVHLVWSGVWSDEDEIRFDIQRKRLTGKSREVFMLTFSLIFLFA